MANSEKKSGLRWFISIFGIAIATALIAVGATYQRVGNNADDIKAATAARGEMKADFTKAIDKVVVAQEETNKILIDQGKALEGIKTEMRYMRRNWRNNHD